MILFSISKYLKYDCVYVCVFKIVVGYILSKKGETINNNQRLTSTTLSYICTRRLPNSNLNHPIIKVRNYQIPPTRATCTL